MPPPVYSASTTAPTKVHRCDYDGCAKTFSRKSNLKAHMRLHTGEKPYSCADCGKRFKWKSCMASHERVHSRRLDHPLSAAAQARKPDRSAAANPNASAAAAASASASASASATAAAAAAAAASAAAVIAAGNRDDGRPRTDPARLSLLTEDPGDFARQLADTPDVYVTQLQLHNMHMYSGNNSSAALSDTTVLSNTSTPAPTPPHHHAHPQYLRAPPPAPLQQPFLGPPHAKPPQPPRPPHTHPPNHVNGPDANDQVNGDPDELPQLYRARSHATHPAAAAPTHHAYQPPPASQPQHLPPQHQPQLQPQHDLYNPQLHAPAHHIVQQHAPQYSQPHAQPLPPPNHDASQITHPPQYVTQQMALHHLPTSAPQPVVHSPQSQPQSQQPLPTASQPVVHAANHVPQPQQHHYMPHASAALDTAQSLDPAKYSPQPEKLPDDDGQDGHALNAYQPDGKTMSMRPAFDAAPQPPQPQPSEPVHSAAAPVGPPLSVAPLEPKPPAPNGHDDLGLDALQSLQKASTDLASPQFSLLGYYHTKSGPTTPTTLDKAPRAVSTEMAEADPESDSEPEADDADVNGASHGNFGKTGHQLGDDAKHDVGDGGNDEEDDNDDLIDDSEDEESMKVAKELISLHNSRHNSMDRVLAPGEIPFPDRTPSRSFGSGKLGSGMDMSQALGLTIGSGILKLQGEDGGDLLQYFGVKSKSRSNSEHKMSTDSRMQSDGTAELGLQYYTREPSAALQRLSGSIKYNNGRWSGNMSDILTNGVEGLADDSAGGSAQNILSLVIPDSTARGSYSNSVSPLGMAITTPCASPRTAIAYTHHGFTSPRNSFSMMLDRFPMTEKVATAKDDGT